MKNILSILLASFILLSGMHLSVARHICGGEVADVKISFSEDHASCGMEENENTCSTDGELTSGCCSNDLSVFEVDNYFSSSSLQIKEAGQPALQLFFLPLIQSIFSPISTSQAYTDVSPPDLLIANGVSLPKICVFRIWCTGNNFFSPKGMWSPGWKNLIAWYCDI